MITTLTEADLIEEYDSSYCAFEVDANKRKDSIA